MIRASLRSISVFAILTALIILTASLTAQNSALPTPSQTESSHAAPDQSSYVLKTYARLVNLEVVVKDSKGKHIQEIGDMIPIRPSHPVSTLPAFNYTSNAHTGFGSFIMPKTQCAGPFTLKNIESGAFYI